MTRSRLGGYREAKAEIAPFSGDGGALVRHIRAEPDERTQNILSCAAAMSAQDWTEELAALVVSAPGAIQFLKENPAARPEHFASLAHTLVRTLIREANSLTRGTRTSQTVADLARVGMVAGTGQAGVALRDAVLTPHPDDKRTGVRRGMLVTPWIAIRDLPEADLRAFIRTLGEWDNYYARHVAEHPAATPVVLTDITVLANGSTECLAVIGRRTECMTDPTLRRAVRDALTATSVGPKVRRHMLHVLCQRSTGAEWVEHWLSLLAFDEKAAVEMLKSTPVARLRGASGESLLPFFSHANPEIRGQGIVILGLLEGSGGSRPTGTIYQLLHPEARGRRSGRR